VFQSSGKPSVTGLVAVSDAPKFWQRKRFNRVEAPIEAMKITARCGLAMGAVLFLQPDLTRPSGGA